MIRRTTGPAAVAVATSGDAKRELDVRKRRLNKEPEDTDEREETEEDIAGEWRHREGIGFFVNVAMTISVQLF